MNAPALRLRDLAVCIRSKNAGPFMLTIDLFFKGAEDCRRVIDARALTPENIAAIYRVDAASVKIIYVRQAHALKVSLPRARAAGDVGDCDVAGGQQFAPLMDLAVPA
jgi:hypothetical protein